MAVSKVISAILLPCALLIWICRGDVRKSFPCSFCTCTTLNSRTSADCSSRGLQMVPEDLPPDTDRLDLSNNTIVTLSSGLKRYEDLLTVNLSYNHIFAFNEDDFVNLSNLTVLDLRYNRLKLKNITYPIGLFRHQQRLSKLFLHHNSESEGTDLKYPDVCFSNITSLDYLSIDGLRNPVFGEGFQHLLNLKTLILGGNCDIRTIRNETFRYMPRVRYLSLKTCVILYIEPAAFQPMRNIHELDLSDNLHLGVTNFGIGLYGLQNSSIKILRANRILTHHGTGVLVRNENVKYLTNTQLEELHFDGNRVEVLDSEVIPSFPTTLKRLSAQDNMILFGMYLLTASTMTGLEWGDASWQHQSYAQPFSVKDIHCDPQETEVKGESFAFQDFTQKIGLPEVGFDSFKDNWPGNFTVHIPPNMTVAKISHSKLSYTIRKIQFAPNKMKVLDLSHNFFTRWEGPIIGFEQLEYIDLSHNYCDYVSDEMTFYLYSIKTINCSSNYLGYSLTNKSLETPRMLEVLDLSNNKINRLPADIFTHLVNMKHLYLGSNYLATWDVNIGNMKNLTELDLSNNLFEELPENLEHQLILIRNSKLRVHLYNNPFKCTCKTVSSLRWIQTNGFGIINVQDIKCTFPDGSEQSMKNLHDLLLQLEKMCASYVGIMFGILSTVILVFGVLISGFMYRYRWKLRYLYYLTLNRHRGYMPQADEQTFEFNAFISYADEDRGFVIQDMRTILEYSVEETFRLCIHHRDFLPGEAIAANILKAINTSRKTVVILTRNFLKSYWCRYEVEMAKMESIYRGRNTLLIVVMEDIPVKDLPVDIVEVMKNDSYIEFTSDSEGQEVFWLNLKRALRS